MTESTEPRPNALLAARLAVRERTRRFELAVIVMLSIAFVGFTLLARALELSVVLDGAELIGVVSLAVFYFVPAGALWWSSRRQRQAEQRLAWALPRRAAHSTSPPLVSVLGGVYLSAVTVTYLGGVAIGLGIALLAEGALGQSLGSVFAAGTLLAAAITATVAAEEVRRPALAEDDDSLIIDDQLRKADAHRVLPLPLPVAFVLSIVIPSTAASVALLGYAVLGGVLWAAVLWTDRRNRTRQAVP